jgi:S1-C subfamily serine protease
MWGYLKAAGLALMGIGMIAAGVELYAPVPVAASTASPTVLVELAQGHGSGVHIGNGLFVTAAHVIDDVTDATVNLDDGSIVPVEVLWVNKAYDLALLKATGGSVMVRTAAMDCTAPEMNPGTPVQVVGNPLNLRNIHTWGQVSRVTERGSQPRFAFIADITIAPGNSGGPAFDKQGRLVGIVVAMAAFNGSPVPLSYIVPVSALCTLLGRA